MLLETGGSRSSYAVAERIMTLSPTAELVSDKLSHLAEEIFKQSAEA